MTSRRRRPPDRAPTDPSPAPHHTTPPLTTQPTHFRHTSDVNNTISAVANIYSFISPSYMVHTHTHPFNGPLSRTTWVSRYQKGKTNLDFNEARDSEWQWHQLGHMQVCSVQCAPCSRQITTPTAHHSVFTGRMPFLPPSQQRQSTEGKSQKSHLIW